MELVFAAVAAVVLAAVVIGVLVLRRHPRSRDGGTAAAPPRAEPAAAPSRAEPVAAEPDGLAGRIRSLFGSGVADPWPRFEELLVRADVGPATSARVVDDVRER